MGDWLSFITSLPTENAILRQRAWRALKASGTAMQRDGVYLMPERESSRATLERLQINVHEGGDKTLVLRIEELEDANFIALFDRSADYAVLLSEVAQIRESLRPESVQEIINLDQESCRLPARSGWCGKCAPRAARTPSSTTIDYWPQHLTCLTVCWQVLTKEYPRNEST